MKNNDIKYNLIIGLLTIIACLPFRVLYLLSDLMFVILYFIIRYRRKVVDKNLHMVFKDKDECYIKAVERKFYRHMCDCIVETVKLLHISDNEIEKRVIVTNGEYIDQITENGKSVVLMLGHYGNWEWVQVIAKHFNNMEVTGQIYEPLHNKTMDKVMLKIRSRFGLTCIPQKNAIRTILHTVNSNKKFIIGFISDQRPRGTNLHNWTNFLGIETAYLNGGESIYEHVEAEMVYLDVEKQKRGHYKMTFKAITPPTNDIKPNKYTREYLNMLEENILKAPEYWLWSHNRWVQKRKVQNK